MGRLPCSFRHWRIAHTRWIEVKHINILGTEMILVQGGPSASGKNYVDDNWAIAPGWIGGVIHVLNEHKQGIAL